MIQIEKILASCSKQEQISVPTFEILKCSKRIIAAFQWWTQKIIINESYLEYWNLPWVIRHEFEHYYQYLVYPNQYLFWNPIPGETDEFYLECSHSGICPIELDADKFGQSLGQKNLRFLLEEISVPELQRYKKDHYLSGLEDRILLLRAQNR